MKESVIYQAIVEEGRVAELHETILDLGREKFGSVDSGVEMALRGITHLERLRRLRHRLLHAATWQELLGTP